MQRDLDAQEMRWTSRAGILTKRELAFHDDDPLIRIVEVRRIGMQHHSPDAFRIAFFMRPFGPIENSSARQNFMAPGPLAANIDDVPLLMRAAA